jgi:hypothetical protein
LTSKTNENIEKTSEIFLKDQHLSIQMIAEMSNMDKEMERQILHNQLNMRNKSMQKFTWQTSSRNKKTTGKTFSDIME